MPEQDNSISPQATRPFMRCRNDVARDLCREKRGAMKKRMVAISRSIYTRRAAAPLRFSQAPLRLFALSLRTGQAIEFRLAPLMSASCIRCADAPPSLQGRVGVGCTSLPQCLSSSQGCFPPTTHGKPSILMREIKHEIAGSLHLAVPRAGRFLRTCRANTTPRFTSPRSRHPGHGNTRATRRAHGLVATGTLWHVHPLGAVRRAGRQLARQAD